MLFPRRAVSRRRKMIALVVAGAIDMIQLAFFPLFSLGFLMPLEDGLDMAAAAALLAVLGFRWELALAFIAELVPALALFPTWTAFVLILPTHDPASPRVPVEPDLPPEPPSPAGPVQVTRIPPVIGRPTPGQPTS